MASQAEVHQLLREPLRLGRGRKAIPVLCEDVGEVTVEDLLRATNLPAAGSINVISLRQSHHHIARLVAKGAKTSEISALTGMTAPRISTLKSDPLFKELVEYYTDMDEEQYENARADMHKRLAALGFDATEILHERLLEKPDDFSDKMILAIVEASADRTGYGKTSTVNHDHAHSLSPATIAALKQSANEGRPLAQEDRGALLRIAADRTAQEYPEAETIDGEPGSWRELREEGDPLAEAPVRAEPGEVS